MSVAALHILASGWDQFVANVLRQEGQLHQVRTKVKEKLFLAFLLHSSTVWELVSLKKYKS